MSHSIYDASVPQFLHMLGAMTKILDKAEAYAAARKIDPMVLSGARLYPDMLPLTRQVLIACDFAKGAGARLAGVEVPKYEDTETTFSELKARIAKTCGFLKTLDRKAIEAGSGRDISLTSGGRKMEFKGNAYLTQFVLPNFYFHLATAYGLLRHNGLEVGKMDFMGGA